MRIFTLNTLKQVRTYSKMSLDIEKIGQQKLKNAVSGEEIEIKSLWQDQDAGIIFFRRWGCAFCRLWAKELQEITPILKENNIKLVGVGFEDLGKDDFVNGKFFDGDVFVVSDKSTYNALGFKRFGWLGVMMSLFYKEARSAISKARGLGVGGNMKGDGLQNGGALFVEKGGKLLRHYVQEGPVADLPNLEILKIFNLEDKYKPAEKPEQKETVTCGDTSAEVKTAEK